MYDSNDLLYLHTLNHQALKPQGALKASLVDDIRFISASRDEFVKFFSNVYILIICVSILDYIRVRKSMKFDLSIFQVWEKFGKKKAEYELIFVSRLLPVFRFFNK